MCRRNSLKYCVHRIPVSRRSKLATVKSLPVRRASLAHAGDIHHVRTGLIQQPNLSLLILHCSFQSTGSFPRASNSNVFLWTIIYGMPGRQEQLMPIQSIPDIRVTMSKMSNPGAVTQSLPFSSNCRSLSLLVYIGTHFLPSFRPTQVMLACARPCESC